MQGEGIKIRRPGVFTPTPGLQGRQVVTLTVSNKRAMCHIGQGLRTVQTLIRVEGATQGLMPDTCDG